MLRIRIQAAGKPSRTASFEDVSRIRIGRALDNEVVLDAPYVSRYHAELRMRGGRWFARDCGSRAGTGVRPPHTSVTHSVRGADEVPLHGGELLVLHDTTLELEIKPDDDSGPGGSTPSAR